jgi:DNA invertase Pin-like site-specific DNA recombinase
VARARTDDLAAGIVAAARREVQRQKRLPSPSTSVRVVGYVRVSTEEQGDQGAGMEAQRRAITTACLARGWELAAIHEDVASCKSVSRRPRLETAMAAIRSGDAVALVVAKMDRLSRSVIDAARTIEDARREGWNLVALDLGVDFSTAAGTAMAQMTAVFAELERRLIGEWTRAALAVKKAQCVHLGRPPALDEKVRRRIRRERAAGRTLRAIADRLNADAVPTGHGGARWHPSTVRFVVAGGHQDGKIHQ